MTAVPPLRNGIARAACGPAAIFAGRCVYAASQFAILIAVGRWCGAESVGEVVLGLAVAVPLFALFGGQLRLVQATDGERRFGFRSVERAGLVGHAIGLAVFAAIALSIRREPDSLATLLGVGLARAAESWADAAYGSLQRRRALAAIGWSTAAKSAGGTLAAIVLLANGHSVGLAYAACASVSLLVSVGVDRRLALRGSDDRPRTSAFRDLLAVSGPLAAGAALAAFDTQIPRYFVEGFLGSQALGTFGVAHYAALALLTLIVPLTYAWTPALADDVAAGDREAFERRLRRALVLGTTLAAAAAALAAPGASLAAAIFADPRIGEGWTFPLVVCAAGALAPAAVLEAGLRAARGFRTLSLLQASSLAIHVACCFEGVRLFGLEGAAAATFARSIAYLATLAVAMQFARRQAFARFRPTHAARGSALPTLSETRAAA